MESHVRTNPSANSSLGFCLLPSELIHNILLNLALPDIKSLGRANKCLSSIITDPNFVREFNNQSRSTSWLFFGKKRWPQDGILHGFTHRAGQWFMIPIAKLLKPVIFPGEDLYFLTANGNVFLFASNTQRALIAADLMNKRVKKIPPSPLGPRGTSSWRRYGMKLVGGLPGSGHFRFMFVEVVDNSPTLFLYCSETDQWQSMEAGENPSTFRGLGKAEDYMFLNLINGPQQNILVAVGSTEALRPLILRPRFANGRNPGAQLTATSGWIDRLHVYGDGYMVIVRSEDADRGMRMLGSIELWGLSMDGSQWEFASRVPEKLMERLRKPYGVLMGCLEAREGTVRAALVSTFEGQWDIIWLSYEVRGRVWAHVPVPDCQMKGSNMAGISFSSGLSLP
ncbi:uncharacterized protein LOC116194207 [Punica granatum]|uniref:F-box domain-containing protein n=2 Tax=Punica granatum TaxID=22663 RepID=A0A218WH75_PUNGR|nr:uncharacterized protein LOC116194207 [Punica granatum]OWM71710.1 hypothetical protein CDL15_Pgr005898 [Punica granatum]PKI46245.1 hypothetical protein CRG98_033372 [Punica granatum]